MKLDPFAMVVLAASGSLYLAGLTRVSVPRGELAAFAGGWLTMAVALLSPIATLSEALFSVHMTQHELLMLVAAPLLTLGRPLVPMLFALPYAWRIRLRGATSGRALSLLLAPPTVFALHLVALWIWHVPALYEAAVRSDSIHLVQHVSFVGTACLFWWGLLRGRYGRLGYGAAVIYVFATGLHSGGLGALLTLLQRPAYPVYVERAHLHGVDPLEDQQLAGLIMWIPAGVLFLIFGLAIFAAWLGEAERRRRIQDV
jgi:putative membrane protein